MSLTNDKPSRQQSIGDGVAVQIDAISAELLEQIGQAREQLDRAETNLLDQAAKAKQMIAGVIDATTAIVAASYSFSKTVHAVAANNARPLVIEKPTEENRE